MTFKKIKSTAFNDLQKDSGMILSSFDPTGKTEIQDSDFLFTTTGGVNPSAVPTISDWGEDVDGCPNGCKELMEIDSWEAQMSFTALNVTEDSVRNTLGAADKTAMSGTSAVDDDYLSGYKITPRSELKSSDFLSNVWWVGPLTDGGYAACCLKNALSTGGFSIQTSKKGKGTVSVTLKGSYSLSSPDDVPIEYYIIHGKNNATTTSNG